jgi:hypothetical protein
MNHLQDYINVFTNIKLHAMLLLIKLQYKVYLSNYPINYSILKSCFFYYKLSLLYRGADKSLAQPGRKQATATEDFDFDISYL